jgi:hypothetical protein
MLFNDILFGEWRGQPKDRKYSDTNFLLLLDLDFCCGFLELASNNFEEDVLEDFNLLFTFVGWT